MPPPPALPVADPMDYIYVGKEMRQLSGKCHNSVMTFIVFWDVLKYLKCPCLRPIEFRFRQLETYDRLSVQYLSLCFVRTNKHYLTYNCIIEMSTGPKFPARPANFFVGFSPELIYYKILQWFKYWGKAKTHENL